ncbi:hypothetical protein ACIQXQ_18415 [Peribacillus sp. NPDC097198]|uniref:hypothetical protein n=1 Tax=Peribacillus sp. NPDC097198 TaxID=3364397 RepID=UPI00380503DA
MVLVWAIFFIEVFVLTLLKPLITDFESATLYLIAFNVIFVFISFIKYRKGIRELLFAAFVLRLLTMFWDVYARNIYLLPHSGNDSEGFLISASHISNDLSLLKTDMYGGLYTKALGVLFYITEPERLLGQYINVLLGVSIIVFLYKILSLLEINKKTKELSITLLCFFPQAIIFSGILLRENIISFLVVISFYFFIKWYKYGKKFNGPLSIIFLAIASIFHSGVIGILVGYIFMFMFSKQGENKLTFNRNTIVIFFLFTFASLFSYTQLNEFLFSKFNSIQEVNDLYDSVNDRIGSSTYLVGLNVDSIWKLIFFSPIKMFYFLTSPLPMDWRGLSDIISFFLDGLIYLGIMMYCAFHINKWKKGHPLIIGVLVMLLAVVFIFGMGVANAGTAIRHRHKIYPIIIIIFALVNHSKKSRLQSKEIKEKGEKSVIDI